MNIISASYGNDSLALIQLAHELKWPNVIVVYIDTGWAGEGWHKRVDECEDYSQSLGFETIRIKPSLMFADLMMLKQGFPNQRYQWCSGFLKGLPFLDLLCERDPKCKATIHIGKRRDESKERANTPKRIPRSAYHGDRKLVHMLYKHSIEERDALIRRAGFEPLPHRSRECDPCVNSNAGDFRRLHQADIDKTEALEHRVGKTMFRPKRHNGAIGIKEVVKWAGYGKGKYQPGQGDLFSVGCGSFFGCGL